VGMDALLRVLREETAAEVRRLREEAERESTRIIAEARQEAERLRESALAREVEARATRLRGLRGAAAMERDRALLLEERRQLERLRAEALQRLREAITEEDVERLVREVVTEAGPVAAILVVDPGSEEAARRALKALGPASPPEIRAAPAPRGGVGLVTGALVLDDTVESRLERAWPRLEAEIARLLFAEIPGDGDDPAGAPRGER